MGHLYDLLMKPLRPSLHISDGEPWSHPLNIVRWYFQVLILGLNNFKKSIIKATMWVNDSSRLNKKTFVTLQLYLFLVYDKIEIPSASK